MKGGGAQRYVKPGLPWVCSHTKSLTAEGAFAVAERKKKTLTSCFGLCAQGGWGFGKESLRLCSAWL